MIATIKTSINANRGQRRYVAVYNQYPHEFILQWLENTSEGMTNCEKQRFNLNDTDIISIHPFDLHTITHMGPPYG